ncbi:MAG: hypothetical protein LBS00_13315 [Synergistaceae bacterium]|jgi:hypothetical protein|nr:hypothetical protein [Synergistaceae bacterium]
MTSTVKILKYEEMKNKKTFHIEPSRRGTKKTMDPEQLRIFAKRQKRLSSIWHKMGVVSWRIVENENRRNEAGDIQEPPYSLELMRSFDL